MRKCVNRCRTTNKPPTVFLTVVFAFVVFLILGITMLIMGTIAFILHRLNIFSVFSSHNIWIPIIGYGIASMVTGTAVALLISKTPLKPINKMIHGMNELAQGNYDARIDLGHFPIPRQISESFNVLAEELEQTEMLRSDFVNNFSHEFKTPIVSICGFAKLLKKDYISQEKQKEYLDIIIEESTRLSDMATKILNLTKLENQSILTEIESFNLSEQIRNSVLMLENKWEPKRLQFNMEYDDYVVNANEELLKQVWINIIDNAIKFSPEEDCIDIIIKEKVDEIKVSIANHGPEMSQEEIKYIYNKFWQADTSHASEGNGIGMSIARRIVELHRGNIEIESSLMETKFMVTIPK